MDANRLPVIPKGAPFNADFHGQYIDPVETDVAGLLVTPSRGERVPATI
ncbi:hypothetical protein [Streptomyces europaeiscabiei]